VRWFVVEFVGDVAAYVSAPWLDRFFKLRDEIKKVCCDVTRGVYDCNEYDRIVLVGHSLGSVVAYDVLNTLINEDLLGKTPGVIRRTTALLTFGSPLDKTAFVFRMQNVAKQYVREALASAVQPLIVLYKYRPPIWLNIWSPSDVISGSLEFYDAADAGPSEDRRVRNRVDRRADLPLIAHVQYWNNPLLGICLLEALNAPVETYVAQAT
jgi:pimeloyl-ACP methyl ester carboxylesterase